jgi:hypothetical protein
VREARRAAKRAAGLSPDVDLPLRRFTTGQAVEAFTGDGANNGWSKGTIVGINYREPEWPESEVRSPRKGTQLLALSDFVY